MRIRFALLVLFLAPLSLRAEEPRKPFAPEEAKKAFLKLLDRPKVSLDVKVVGEPKETDGLITEKLSFASEKKTDGTFERVPTLIVRPAKKGKYPAVIALHGTGGNKDGLRSWLVDLAKRGIIGVAIDARYHGERSGGAKGSSAYITAITKAWKTPKGEPQEHPFYYDTCWDLWRTLDYLETRQDVDAKKLGMIGISMGGIETWLAASVDDRVKVLRRSSACKVSAGAWKTINGKAGPTPSREPTTPRPRIWASRRSIRRFAGNSGARSSLAFSTSSIARIMLRLFAGRPLLIANGELDGNCPIEGAKLAFKAAEDAFAKANAKNKLKILVAEKVGHKVTEDQRKATLEWFSLWLL